MQSQATSPALDGAHWASATVLGITIRQLHEWEAQASRHLVIVPKADEEAWEDTEMDVRRTAL